MERSSMMKANTNDRNATINIRNVMYLTIVQTELMNKDAMIHHSVVRQVMNSLSVTYMVDFALFNARSSRRQDC